MPSCFSGFSLSRFRRSHRSDPDGSSRPDSRQEGSPNPPSYEQSTGYSGSRLTGNSRPRTVLSYASDQSLNPRPVSAALALRILFQGDRCTDPSCACSVLSVAAQPTPFEAPASGQRGWLSVQFLSEWSPSSNGESVQSRIFTRYLEEHFPPSTDYAGQRAIRTLKTLAQAALMNNTRENLLALMKGFRDVERTLGGQGEKWDLPDNQLDAEINDIFDSRAS